jgi:hypothetical protein
MSAVESTWLRVVIGSVSFWGGGGVVALTVPLYPGTDVKSHRADGDGGAD